MNPGLTLSPSVKGMLAQMSSARHWIWEQEVERRESVVGVGLRRERMEWIIWWTRIREMRFLFQVEVTEIEGYM